MYRSAKSMLSWTSVSTTIILCAAIHVLAVTQEKPPAYNLASGSDTIIACGYKIMRRMPDGNHVVAQFTVPTVSMLLRYRPYIRDNYGFDTTAYKLVDVVEDVSSDISAACLHDGRVWVGFGFYEGEGWDGIGGIGFYDLRTGDVGVLRHPALIDFSVIALKVSEDTVYAITRGNFEGARSVGNGVVAISRKTLVASARVPPGSSTIWDKDNEEKEPVAPLYERPIEQLIADSRFVAKDVSGWPEKMHDTIASMGSDQYMGNTLNRERMMRQASVSRATIVFDELIRASAPEHIVGEVVGKSGIVLVTPWVEEVKLRCGVDGFPGFVVRLPGMIWFEDFDEINIKPTRAMMQMTEFGHDWASALPGDIWTYESSHNRLTIRLDSLVKKEVNCSTAPTTGPVEYYESAAIHIEYLKLND